MSSGQRVALAISIFLTLNRNMKTAPAFLLFDDPVAHVNDINILSFLDYLREIVINEDKQVFFATANDRIAKLFLKKFDFLVETNEFNSIYLERGLNDSDWV